MKPSPQTAPPVLDARTSDTESRAMSAPQSFKSEFLKTLQARGYIHQITHPDELDAAAAAGDALEFAPDAPGGEEIGAEIGEQRPERAGDAAHRLGSFTSRLELVAHVESAHHQRSAVPEDDRGRVRIGPDVELRGRRSVAERAATHQRDACDAVR